MNGSRKRCNASKSSEGKDIYGPGEDIGKRKALNRQVEKTEYHG